MTYHFPVVHPRLDHFDMILGKEPKSSRNQCYRAALRPQQNVILRAGEHMSLRIESVHLNLIAILVQQV